MRRQLTSYLTPTLPWAACPSPGLPAGRPPPSGCRVPASRGIGESLMPQDTGDAHRAQVAAQGSPQLGADSQGGQQFGFAPSGLRKCREVRVTRKRATRDRGAHQDGRPQSPRTSRAPGAAERHSCHAARWRRRAQRAAPGSPPGAAPVEASDVRRRYLPMAFIVRTAILAIWARVAVPCGSSSPVSA